jgi:hypothetical protein
VTCGAAVLAARAGREAWPAPATDIAARPVTLVVRGARLVEATDIGPQTDPVGRGSVQPAVLAA